MFIVGHCFYFLLISIFKIINIIFLLYKIFYIFQRDETSNTSTPTKLLPIDQIISHIANTNLEKQQVAHIVDSQTTVENTSAEASRRSSTSTQNTDTLTPTNIPSDPTDNQETIISATSVETVMENYNIQDDVNNSAFKSYQNTNAAQIQDITVNASYMNESRKESQEQQDAVDIKESGTVKETSDVAAEISNLIVPAPVRKVSRFLVSPVVEQKNITIEDEVVNEDRTNVAASQIISQSIVPTNVESTLKIEDHTEANIPGIHNMTMHEQANNNEMVQGIQYAMEQADNTQQLLQQGQQQQPIGLQQNIIQVQTLQQVTGHMQQTTTIGQAKQHTIIVQGGAMTTQQTAQQMPQTGVQHFMPVNSQKELSTQPLHVNGITQTQIPMQYPNQTVVQSGVVMQQPQQQISMQTSMMQPHVQAEHQLQGQMQTQCPTVQQFVPQQIQPSTQQYVMMPGQPIIQPIQPMSIDDRNRRIASLSATSNVSMDLGISDSSNISEEKRQNVPVANVPVVHMQHTQIVPPDMSNAMPLTQNIVENSQQLQTVHQNIQHVSGPMPQSMPVPMHSIAATDISAPKMTIKTKEVSSTLPDLAQNLANILSNPKSKSVTPHPLTTHESIAVPNVAAGTSVDYKSVQSEQYFQPIQPEASQLQPPIQHNYQGQIVHQTYQNQQSFQQAFQNQQLLHQNQAQPISQSIPLTIPQPIDVQSQMVPTTFQNVSGQSIVQGKWIVSTNQTLLQQPLRNQQQNQPPQLLQNHTQLQQISMPLQMQQQTIADQQHSESSIIDQSHLHLKLPEQHPVKLMETENLESSNSNE